MNTLIFDIETVPDVELDGASSDLKASDDEVGKAMQARARQESGSAFFHTINIASSPSPARFVPAKAFASGASETRAHRARAGGTLLRWRRQVHARARELERRRLRSAGAALPRPAFQSAGPRYWETGDEDTPFATKTISAAFTGATSMSGRTLGHQARARASLSDAAVLLGFPGSSASTARRCGTHIAPASSRASAAIARPTSSHLAHLRALQHMRGRLTDAGLADELARTAPGSPMRSSHTSTSSSPLDLES